MNTHKFYPQQEPQPEEFDEAFLDSSSNLLKRIGVMLRPGILPANELYAVTSDSRYLLLGEFPLTIDGGNSFMLHIGSGIAFNRAPISNSAEQPYEANNPIDLKMERIFISPSDMETYNAANPDQVDVLGNALPKSTGHRGILLSPSTVYYIYVAYLHTVDTLTTDPSNPGNKYTIDPVSGDLDYVHWVDGYRVRVLTTASVDVDDIYLGTVTTSGIGITTIATAGRQYASIPTANVRGLLSASLLPAGYTSESEVSLSAHINAIGDITKVSPTNPHGVVVESPEALLPAGIILPFGGTMAPEGYALCDGSVLDRDEYADLFAVIGTSYGDGVAKPVGATGTPGANMFNVPDLRGAFLRGVDGPLGRDPDKNVRVAGATGGNAGNAVGSLQTGAIQSHTHTVKADHYLSGAGAVGYANPGPVPVDWDNTETTDPTGGLETRPINIYVNYIIRY